MPSRAQIAAHVRATEQALKDRVTSAVSDIIGRKEAERIAKEVYADADDGFPELTDHERHLIERHERRSGARRERSL